MFIPVTEIQLGPRSLRVPSHITNNPQVPGFICVSALGTSSTLSSPNLPLKIPKQMLHKLVSFVRAIHSTLSLAL